ncbi:MAG: aminoglycoside phosphotransferase family protein [Deltaproteobacteria bacterium]|nr:aminoglycoside phosphotransferase family protein [Deltaproteobacteria bacterium]
MQVQHRLIIRHPLQTAILLVNDNGEPRLPAFTSDDRHTAEVDYINAAVHERFGLVTTVLRSLSHSDPRGDVVERMHELETHGGSVLRLNTLRWYERAELLSLPDGEDRSAIAEWLAGETAHRMVVDGREWTRPGWLDEARSWIERSLRDTGLGSVREIVQLRAWPSSCVLRVRAASGDCYFKAVPESLRRECAVTGYLAHHFPDAVPRVIATDPERRWLLMAACVGRTLGEVTDVALWERAVARYARLQTACVPRVPELGALGCTLRSLDALAEAIGPLSYDTMTLRPGEPDGLSTAEIERLQALVPSLRRQCAQLAACGIPFTLEHGDLWPENFLVDQDTCVIIDWEDVAVAHPFFSLAPLSVGLGIYQSGLHSPAARDRLEHAYLAACAEMAPPERLRTALHIAAPLSFIDMAVRYRHQPPSVVQLHPWMRDLVPQTLRLALACIP